MEHTTVCDKCYRKTWYEVEMPCQVAGCTGTLKVIDKSELNPRATQFYKSGERVEIIYSDGEKTRCYIGKSTGWKPVYLEVKKSNSMGGGALYLPENATIRGVGRYRA